MVERTLKVYECDVCGEEGDRYTVGFPDGQKTLDRCQRHGAKIQKLRDEKGSWTPLGKKSAFKVSSVDDIRKQL